MGQIVFIDGAEHYSRQDFKWTNFPNSSALASGVAGAHGLVNDDSVWGAKFISFTATDVVSVRFRIRFRVNTVHEFFHLQGEQSFTHLQLRRNADGTISVLAPFGAVTSVGTYPIDTWFEMEFGARISQNGEYIFKSKVSSGPGPLSIILADAGVDTQNVTAYANRVGLGSEALDTYTDDAAIDITGVCYGGGEVETLYPNGVGSVTSFTRFGVDSFANWSQVDEAIGDLTDSVFNEASGARDSYTFQDRSISGTPRAVQLTAFAHRHVSGTFTFKLFCLIDGDYYDSSTTFTVANDPGCYSYIWNVNPATNGVWTDDDIDSAEFGVLGITANIEVHQLVLEVFVSEEENTCFPVVPGFRHYCESVNLELA